MPVFQTVTQTRYNWSDEVKILDRDDPPGNEFIWLTAPSDPGVYYFGACIEDVSNESNTNNNCSAAVAITVRAPDPNEPPAVPDLIIESPTASPSTLGPGESFTLNVTVRNKGTATSPATTLRWYRSPNSKISMNDTEIAASANVKSLRADRTATQQISRTAPMAAGTYYYGGCVESVTDESDTANNCSSAIEITVQNLAPIAVGTISGQTLYVGDTPMRLSVSPYFSDANNTSLTYTADSSDTNVADTEAAGVSGSNLTIHPIAEGSATITVTASDGELTATQTFSVTVNPITISESPDLVVSLSATENFVTPNSHFKLQATVRNRGNTDTSDLITLRYFVSSDATISSDDDEISTASIENLKIGIPEGQDYGLRASQKPGVYYYYACVDSVTGEENTDNNCSNFVTVNVLGSDLIVESVSVDLLGQTDSINPNGNFRLNATVRNQGTADAAATTVRFYISSDQTLSSDDSEVQIAGIGAINTGTLANVQSATIQSPYASGVFYCFVCVDDVTNETDTTNNCSAPIQITIVSAETWMPDAGLRAAIRSALGLNAGDPLTKQKMTTLTSLSATDRQIINLTGLEYATTLTSLDLHYNQIRDLTPLENLAALTVLRIGANQMTNITPLGNLTALTELWLPYNDQISDFTPLINLTALTKLILYQTQIRDLTPLENLTGLTELWLYDNGISDIEPLKSLTALTSLQIQNNQISDVSSLEGLTALRTLYLSGNSITDYAPLRRLKTKNPNLSMDITIPAAPTPNRAPVAVGTISSQSLRVGGSAVAISVSGNFSDADNDTLTYTANSSSTSVATVTMSNSQVTITPVAAGSATITVTASDGSLTAAQTIAVTVTAAPITNRAPIAADRTLSWTMILGVSHSPLDVSGEFSDPDNDTLTYTANSSATSVATVSVSGSLVTITPVGTGSATITVTASDGELTATQTIAVTVNTAPVGNRAPIAVGTISAQSLVVGDSTVSVDVSGSFSDADNDSLTYIANSDNTSAATVSISNAQVTITPVAAGSATITVTANDGSLTATQTIAVTVNTALVGNRAPVTVGTISAQSLTVGDSTVSVDVSGNFSDADNDSLTYTANSDNTNVATASASGSQVTITPISAGSATITVTASDGSLTATQTIAVTVNTAPIGNRAPVAVGTISAQSLIVGGSSVSVDVSGSFSDVDNDTLTYTATSSNTSIATVNVSNAQATITPVAAGSATITVTASDGSLTAAQTITISVTASALNRPPVAIESIPPLILTEGSNAATVSISGKFRDWDGNPLTYSVASNNTAVATVSVSGTTVTITPGVTGSATVTVTASDGIASGSQTISVTVRTESTPPSVSVCARTSQVVTEILNRVSGINDCANITTAHLNAITVLFLNRKQLTTLKAGDFSGLNNLIQLEFTNNQLTTLDSNIFSGLNNLTHLQLAVNQLTTLDSNIFSGLNSLKVLQLQSNELTSLDSNIFSGLNNLKTLDLRWNELASLPTGIFAGLSSLTSLDLASNPGAPFTLTLKLERTDNTNLAAPGPATIKVKLAEGAPFQMSVNLSASGGTLSTNTATIARGSTESGSITVTPNGNNSVTVNIGSAPSSPLNYTGIQTAVGESLVMFPQAPDQNQAPAIVGKIPAQLLRVGSSAATVNVSGYFSDPDNDTLTYTASASNTSVTTVGVSGSTVTITPSAAGRSTVTVTANDGSLTATQTIAVAVEVASGAWVCARTPKVRDEIVARAGLTDCVNVTTTHLASITAINLQLKEITTLKEGDFDGLTNLSILWLQNNSISSLPTGIFAGLSNLSDLFLGGNPGAPFTLTLELERTDNSNLLAPGPATVRVKVAEGAPFNITVGLSVQGGTLSANTATIAKGNTVSSAITVTQTGQSGTGVTLGAVTGNHHLLPVSRWLLASRSPYLVPFQILPRCQLEQFPHKS